MEGWMNRCTLCPRRCGADRTVSVGRCGVGEQVRLARAALHFWEEPCVSGEEGSGTVFFSGCSLGCVFCQNYQISAGHFGRDIPVERLAEIFLELQEQGTISRRLSGRWTWCGASCTSRWFTTAAATRRWRRCGCSKATWTSTCPT